jgi:hypothetical protein
VNNVIVFLYLVEKPGDVNDHGRLNPGIIVNVNVPERWG